MNNSKLSKRLHSFPKTQKLSIDTKEKIATLLQEEMTNEKRKNIRNGTTGLIKKVKMPVAIVAAVLIFSLLLISVEDVDFKLGKKNQLNGADPHSQLEETVPEGLYSKEELPTNEGDITDKEKNAEIISVVENFGTVLKEVSLLAPEEMLKKSIEENYEEYLSPRLLKKWLNDPRIALGRMVSSPWPDRIDVIDVKRINENTYEVTGTIIEVTSVEMKSGSAAEHPIILTVKKIENNWLIDNVEVGDYVQNTGVQYENTEYSFIFSLPDSWEGYQIVVDEWEGTPINSDNYNGKQEKGPLLSIRHPKWTTDTPRQDIPIMIFTNTQWEDLQKGEFHIGAAPIGPKELDHNEKYVFALPARYNFEFPEGYEEVEEILAKDPLKAN